MKRILALLLALVMLFCLTACGGDKKSTPAGEDTGASTNTTENTNDPTHGTQDSMQGTTESTIGGEATETNETPTTTTPPTMTPPTTRPTPGDVVNEGNSTTMSFQTLVSQYSGKWYLDGYANVYLHIYKDNDGWLQIYTNNFFLPDIYYGRDDGIVYPFLSGISSEEYCAGTTIPPVYDWKQHTVQCRIVFDDGCIYAGSYKFIRTPGSIEKIFCLSHHMDVPTCQIPSTCIYCGYTEGNPVECQFINGVCHFCGEKSNKPPTTEPPVTEPQPIRVSGVQISKTTLSLKVGDTQQLTATVSPSNADNKRVTWSSSNSSVAQVSSTGKITAKGAGSATITVTTVDGNYTATCAVTVTVPSSPEPVSDVLIISNTQTISNQTIDTDVYITSTGVATFNNVTVNGNIYCYGQLKCSGCTANNVYAYAYGSMMSCGAFDGTHGKVSGGISCNNMTILDNALDYAFSKWGKK